MDDRYQATVVRRRVEVDFENASFDAFFISCYYHEHMLSIRLQRVGRTNDASFRVVLTDSKNSAKSGKFKEILGTFAIKAGKSTLKTDRINYWINNGARPTDTMHNLLIKEGIIEGKKRNVLSKKAPTQKRKELKKK